MSEMKYNSWFIKKISREKEKNVLTAYHYTSPDAFLSIMNDGFVRFTDIHYMNDKSETVYVVKVLLDFLDKNPGKYLFTRDALQILIEKQFYTDIQELRITSINFKEIPHYPYTKYRSFLFCLTTKKDSLNMWNYYVKNGRYEGFAIGVDLYEFLKTFDVPSKNIQDSFLVYHGKVLYQEDHQFAVMKKIVEEIEEWQGDKNEDIYMAAVDLRHKLEKEGLFIKHPEFSSEREYRIVINIADDRIPYSEEGAKKYAGVNNKKMHEDFCIKNGIVAPFLKVKVPQSSIAKVIVSPIAEFSLANKGLEEFLKAKEYKKVVVEQSKIPIRY